MTIRQLVRGALRAIGQLAPGRDVGAAELVDALEVLNSFLDQLNADRTYIYTVANALYTLTPGKQPHTIGPVLGDFNVDRPQRIEAANILVTSGSTTYRRKLRPLDLTQWSSKSYLNVQSIPDEFYNDGGWPLSSIYLYPIPNQAYQIELYTWQLLTKVPDDTVDVDFPPGYADFLKYGLAIRLAPEWNKAPRADVLELFRKAEAIVQSANIQSPRISTESALAPQGGGYYNYLSGQVEP